MLDSTRPVLRPRIAPAGLMFLAITSIGWGFNWPVTKFLLSELPPLQSAIGGAIVLAAVFAHAGRDVLVSRRVTAANSAEVRA